MHLIKLLIYFTICVICSTTSMATYILRRTGRECETSRDCVQNAYCHEGSICMCQDRYIAIETSRKVFICINEASFVGDACLYDLQCTAALGTHAECRRKSETPLISGKCECKNDSHFQDGICYKNSRIGESCKVSDNCVIKSAGLVAYCDQSRCVCPPMFHSNSDGTDCLHSSVLTGPCNSDEDCIIINSRCLNNICNCQIGYVKNDKKSHCLKAADYLYEACDEDVQCTTFLPNTTCDPITRRCNCTSESHEVKGACFKSSRLLEPCTRKEECLIDSRNFTRVQCYNKFCFCADNHVEHNKTNCISMTKSLPDSSVTVQSEISLIFLLSAMMIFIQLR